MSARRLTTSFVAFALVACTHKADDSAAMSRAKTDTNTAVEATKGAIVNATAAARDETRELADRTKAAAARADTSPQVRKTKELAAQAKEDLDAAAQQTADNTRELAAKARDKIGN